jgi:rare lipoprotein A (peptidoglycan hydrolase)
MQFIQRLGTCETDLGLGKNLLPNQMMDVIEKRGLVTRAGRAVVRLCVALVAGAILAALPMSKVSSENTLDRIQAGQWVVASMYWEDKLVSTGKSFNPIGWHAAHKTLPIGTLIRVSNPKNHRSINVTVNDRGPFVANRDLDLTLGAGALLGLQGLGTVYMEVLSIPPVKNIRRPVVESLFAVNDANANCIGVSAC